MLLVICFACSTAIAEGEQSLWDSIGGWFGQAAEDVSNWASQAWSDTTNWIEGAWGDSSKWVEQAWSDSSGWVSNIWGDVSTWAAETYETTSNSISVWWAETFNKVTESATNPWNWLSEETASLRTELRDVLNDVKDAAASDDEAKVRKTFRELAEILNLTEENSERIWSTINAYAEQKGIAPLTAMKLALPYLFQLTNDSGEAKDSIPAIAIAQYLTAIIEKLNVKTSEDANGLIEQLNTVLNGF